MKKVAKKTKQERTAKPNTSELLEMDQYDKIIVAFSGGKDSMACLLRLLDMGVNKDKIELWHHCIDGAPGSENFMDWPVTEAYCRATGEALGIKVRFQWKEGGFLREMLRENQQTASYGFETEDGQIMTSGGGRGNFSTRRKFPQVSSDLSVRWCSSYCKVMVCSAALANLPEFKEGKFLLVTGERRQESAARSMYAEVEKHKTSTRKRRVDQWRAVIDYSEEQIWDLIRKYKLNPHPAYRLGWGRASCMFCIFGGASQWASAKSLNPTGFERIADYENEFGVTIQRKKSVRELAGAGEDYTEGKSKELRDQAVSSIYTAEDMFVENWELPAGAFKECGGPQ